MCVLYELFTELISGFCFLRFLGFTGFYRVFFLKMTSLWEFLTEWIILVWLDWFFYCFFCQLSRVDWVFYRVFLYGSFYGAGWWVDFVRYGLCDRDGGLAGGRVRGSHRRRPRSSKFLARRPVFLATHTGGGRRRNSRTVDIINNNTTTTTTTATTATGRTKGKTTPPCDTTRIFFWCSFFFFKGTSK